MTPRGNGSGIELEIEHLVIHGVSAADSRRLVPIIERELRSMFETSRSHYGGRVELPGGTYEVPAGLDVEAIGRGVARTIWETSAGGGNPRPSQDSTSVESPYADPNAGDQREDPK
jgi:hypothetical protein